jgi:ABC-2 type transport system ATP-binding protein
MVAALEANGLTHRYRQRVALEKLDLEIRPGEIFAILGPNGSGKTTLFRLASTLVPIQAGSLRIVGLDVRSHSAEVRRNIGVVFQSASVDKKLTVSENIHQQGYLYGLSGAQLASRRQDMLRRFGLAERASDRVESLSGGLRRRLELAKGMLHTPRVLLLDEPSTGLDPAARLDVWSYLASLAGDEAATIILTTHLLEEADRADRIAILDQGKLVALDTPENLKRRVGGDAIVIETQQPARLAQNIGERLGLEATVVDGRVRLEVPRGHHWIARLVESFPGQIRSVTLSQPTLEDVFIKCTGHRFSDAPSQGD